MIRLFQLRGICIFAESTADAFHHGRSHGHCLVSIILLNYLKKIFEVKGIYTRIHKVVAMAQPTVSWKELPDAWHCPQAQGLKAYVICIATAV